MREPWPSPPFCLPPSQHREGKGGDGCGTRAAKGKSSTCKPGPRPGTATPRGPHHRRPARPRLPDRRLSWACARRIIAWARKDPGAPDVAAGTTTGSKDLLRMRGLRRGGVTTSPRSSPTGGAGVTTSLRWPRSSAGAGVTTRPRCGRSSEDSGADEDRKECRESMLHPAPSPGVSSPAPPSGGLRGAVAGDPGSWTVLPGAKSSQARCSRPIASQHRAVFISSLAIPDKERASRHRASVSHISAAAASRSRSSRSLVCWACAVMGSMSTTVSRATITWKEARHRKSTSVPPSSAEYSEYCAGAVVARFNSR
mmetsp:Transcript_59232/g.158498  ORF Transcript_59232/g.158498 Transcript_59232/m.158498 type:complete len:312 (-) Transcript_59232:869-1804(-)